MKKQAVSVTPTTCLHVKASNLLAADQTIESDDLDGVTKLLGDLLGVGLMVMLESLMNSCSFRTMPLKNFSRPT